MQMIYRTPSPDEVALAEWSAQKGYRFVRRTSGTLIVDENGKLLCLNMIICGNVFAVFDVFCVRVSCVCKCVYIFAVCTCKLCV